MIASLIRRASHPFHYEDLVPGQEYSALETATGRASLDRVEALFAQGGDVDRIVAAHRAFFDDAEAERALKKGLHITLEARYRIAARRLDKPETYGFDGFSLPQPDSPLDELVAGDQTFFEGQKNGYVPAVPWRNRFRQFFSTLVWGAIFIGAAAAQALRGGGSAAPVRTPLIAPPFWPGSRWNALEKAFVENGAEPGKTVCFIVESTEDGGFSPGPYAKRRLNELPLSRQQWWRQVFVPGMKLIASVLLVLFRNPADAFIVALCREATLQAARSLIAWRIALGAEFHYCLDIYEYSTTHIIKAMVFRKFGAGVARLPHSQMDSRGSSLSYLCYDLLLESGSYQCTAFGNTWSPKCRSVAVGQMQGDARLKQPLGDRRYLDRIEQAVKAGRRIAAFFGSSTVHGMHKISLDALFAVDRLLSQREGWLLVVKPKGSDVIYDYMRADPRFQGWFESDTTLSVHYDELGHEPCPVGWLIDKMDIGFGMPASTQIEALTHARPFLSYYPLPGDTKLQKHLQTQGLRHKTIDGFAQAAAAHFDRETAPVIDYDWFRENFDPFADDMALDRIAAALSTPHHYHQPERVSA